MKTGITGGIGSGKSYVCRLLAAHGIQVYDCDAAAKRLIRTSPDIRQQLTALIGPDTYTYPESPESPESLENPKNPIPLPILNKAAVTRFLLESEDHAKAIDRIVHPAVFRDFEESGMEWMESAILYESGIYRLVDRVVVVTAPDEVRIRRVMQRDGITRETVQKWMQRQWSQEEVCRRADYEIVNDGIADLEAQIRHLLTTK
jgi:dephospho-CoA kinase